ncbi:MAG: 50S ribosomal protein L22 [Candidatus Omnitrophica bacterium]|nr:50S ribosomal protein L22 [Candidatus Omnitrophota bacterium]
MISKAHSKYIRIAPKKARLVADVLRGKRVDEALSLLPNINKKMSEYALDAIRSAYCNAKVKYPQANYGESGLYISKITVDEGPSLRRYRAATMGRASAIKKRTSHMCIELDLVPAKMQDETAKKSMKKVASKKETVKKTVKKTTQKKDLRKKTSKEEF